MKLRRNDFYPVLVLITGLITSQIIFTFVVFRSNIALYSKISAIRDAGYLIVPNQHIVNTFMEIAPAFYGGLFFSLTAGSGITWATLLLVLTWISFSHRKIILIFIFVLWGGLIVITNWHGINFPASSALIIIPIVVGYSVFSLFDKKNARFYWKILLTHFFVLILICLSWLPHLNADTFISVRDFLLLGNSLGRNVNDFYYTYTMYPAEVFKSIDQKILKTCDLKTNDQQVNEVLEKKLRSMDYLSIDTDLSTDVTIIEENHRLVFVHGQKKVMESSLQEFLSDPDKAMSEFSDRCDINSFFRKITFLSLLLGMPITIYFLVHTLVMLALFFITSPNLRFGISAGVSLIIGVSATIPLYYVFSKPLAQADIIGLLNSKDWQTRTAALRKIAEDGMGIDQFMDQIDYSKFYHIPEKYWFARALSQSRNENTIIILHKYLQEPYPNVVCMALYSLGKRNHRASMDLILDLIQSSPQWYVQWYAYKALRRMGWAQPKPR